MGHKPKKTRQKIWRESLGFIKNKFYLILNLSYHLNDVK